MKIILTFLTLISLSIVSTGCEQKKPKEKTMVIDTSKEKCSAGKCGAGKCGGASEKTQQKNASNP